MDYEERKEALFNWAHELKDKNLGGKPLYDFFQYKNTNLWEFAVVGICQAVLERENKKPISKTNFFLRTHAFPKIEALTDQLLNHIIKSTPKPSEKNPIVIVTLDRYWKKAYNPQTQKSEFMDEFFDSIINKLKSQDMPFITIGETNIFRNYSTSPLKILKERTSERQDIPYLPAEIFWTSKANEEGKKARKHFKTLWKSLSASPEFKDLFKFQGEDISPRLNPFFKYYFHTVLPRKIKLISMTKTLLDNLKPSLILAQNESAGWEKILISEANKRNIKTIALQHGIIYKLHEGYFHTQHTNSSFPDLTLVYGPEVERVLYKNNYPKNSVKAIGQPRYDKLVYYQNKKVIANFLKKHNLSSDKKLFLLATQPVEEKVRRELFKNTIEIFKSLKDIQLIIKPHPAETNLDFYKKTLQNTNSNAILLEGKDDTFEAIASSDYFATMTSTVALEAMMFKKPLFIFNFSNYGGASDWVKQGAAIKISSVEQGKETLKRYLNNSQEIKTLLKNQSTFLKKNYYKLDGKATERLYNLIKQHK
jgi:hypothetical protein